MNSIGRIHSANAILRIQMTHITEIDPWLEPFTEHIDGRDAYLRDKTAEILDGKTVAEFALGHIYFGLHKLFKRR